MEKGDTVSKSLYNFPEKRDKRHTQVRNYGAHTLTRHTDRQHSFAIA